MFFPDSLCFMSADTIKIKTRVIFYWTNGKFILSIMICLKWNWCFQSFINFTFWFNIICTFPLQIKSFLLRTFCSTARSKKCRIMIIKVNTFLIAWISNTKWFKILSDGRFNSFRKRWFDGLIIINAYILLLWFIDR